MQQLDNWRCGCGAGVQGTSHIWQACLVDEFVKAGGLQALKSLLTTQRTPSVAILESALGVAAAVRPHFHFSPDMHPDTIGLVFRYTPPPPPPPQNPHAFEITRESPERFPMQSLLCCSSESASLPPKPLFATATRSHAVRVRDADLHSVLQLPPCFRVVCTI